MPPGAVQRFQMLLPILQAQISASRSGAQGNDKGFLPGILASSGKGIADALGKEMGGWGGVGSKIKDLFSGSGPTSDFFPQPTGAGITTGPTGAFDTGNLSPADFNIGQSDPGQWDTGKFTPIEAQEVPDWGGFDPGSADDFLSNFNPQDLAATGGDWGWLD